MGCLGLDLASMIGASARSLGPRGSHRWVDTAVASAGAVALHTSRLAQAGPYLESHMPAVLPRCLLGTTAIPLRGGRGLPQRDRLRKLGCHFAW